MLKIHISLYKSTSQMFIALVTTFSVQEKILFQTATSGYQLCFLLACFRSFSRQAIVKNMPRLHSYICYMMQQLKSVWMFLFNFFSSLNHVLSVLFYLKATQTLLNAGFLYRSCQLGVSLAQADKCLLCLLN